MAHGDDYLVGKGRPPLHTRFQPGRSGNPAGRPKRPKTLRALLWATLEAKVPVRERGRRRAMSRQEFHLRRIVSDAAAGTPAAVRELLKLIAAHPRPKPAAPRRDDVSAEEAMATYRQIAGLDPDADLGWAPVPEAAPATAPPPVGAGPGSTAIPPIADAADGEGSPPTDRRVPPRRSGRRAATRGGRSNAVKTTAELLWRALDAKVAIVEHGRERKVSSLEAILLRIATDAAAGQPHAVRALSVLMKRYPAPKPKPPVREITDDMSAIEATEIYFELLRASPELDDDD